MSDRKNLRQRVREFQKVCWDFEKQSDDYKNDISNWERIYLTRKISVWITYFIRNTPITPNQVTGLWFTLGVAGALLLTSRDYWISILAVSLLYLSWILDNVDGELARVKQQFSESGNLLDMLGHQLIFPLAFGCLTYSLIATAGDHRIIFCGILATAFVTPLTKMQENIWLLLSMKALSRKPEDDSPQDIVPEKSTIGKTGFRKFVTRSVSKIFTHMTIMYLLILSVIFDVREIFLVFYGIGMPLVFIPKYQGRASELEKIALNPHLLKQQFRPEWFDE